MDMLDFKKSIAKVQNYYGKEYNSTQLNEIYKYFQYSTTARFEFVLSKVYQSCSYLPSLAQMVEINKNTPYYNPKKTESSKTNYDCKICGGNGFIIYKKQKNGMEYEYVAHCECKKSLDYRYDGRKVENDKAKSDFYFKSYKQIQIDDLKTLS